MSSEEMSMTVLPDNLSRLPGKQIGRCKCVCRPWRKIIRSSRFMEIYRQRHRGMVLYWWENIFREVADGGSIRRFHFFHCPLRPSPEEFTPLREMEIDLWTRIGGATNLHGVSQLVNGLLCVGEGEKSGWNFRLTLHSICTRETTRLPDPLPCADTISTYHLGYDPASRVYKLLRLIYSAVEISLEGAHIMTLRPPSGSVSSTWRELDYKEAGVCHFHLVSCNVLSEIRTSHADGMLCWVRSPSYDDTLPEAAAARDRLLCFDVNKERFRLIDLPGKYMRFSSVTTRSKNRLALWTIVTDGGDDGQVKGISCYVQEDDQGKHWSKQNGGYYGVGVACGDSLCFSPTGEMLVKNVGDESWRVYSYVADERDDVVYVGKLPEEAVTRLDGCGLYYSWWTMRPQYLKNNARLTCLIDANNLHLSLDDALSGIM